MTWILPKSLHTLASALDTEALISDSTGQSEVCAQSLLVRSKPSPSRIWLRKWKRDSWTRHLCGRILKPSHSQRFTDEWASFLEAFLASPSLPQDFVQPTRTRDTYSLPYWLELWLLLRDSSSSRTLRASSPPSSKATDGEIPLARPFCSMSSENWNAWVTAQRQEYSARKKRAEAIDANECSSLPWPTASTRDWKDSPGMSTERDGNAMGRVDQLPRAVYHQARLDQATLNSSGNLPGCWPTATVNDSRNGANATARRLNPKSRHHAGTTLVDATKTNTGALLNPRWVETLMRIPVGWCQPSCSLPWTPASTNSGFSATAATPSLSSTHSEPCFTA